MSKSVVFLADARVELVRATKVLPSFCSFPNKVEQFCFLDVRRCLLKYLEMSRDFRRSSYLPILFYGPNKGLLASKCSIARWIHESASFRSTCAWQLRGQVPHGKTYREHKPRFCETLSCGTAFQPRSDLLEEKFCKLRSLPEVTVFGIVSRRGQSQYLSLSCPGRLLETLSPVSLTMLFLFCFVLFFTDTKWYISSG